MRAVFLAVSLVLVVVGTEASGRWRYLGDCGRNGRCHPYCCSYWFSNDVTHPGCPHGFVCEPFERFTGYVTKNTCKCRDHVDDIHRLERGM